MADPGVSTEAYRFNHSFPSVEKNAEAARLAHRILQTWIRIRGRPIHWGKVTTQDGIVDFVDKNTKESAAVS